MDIIIEGDMAKWSCSLFLIGLNLTVFSAVDFWFTPRFHKINPFFYLMDLRLMKSSGISIFWDKTGMPSGCEAGSILMT